MDITPTNNGSEQAFRPCAVFRKVTNCFRSEWGAGLYANVKSVLETARRRGIAILRAIRLTLDGIALPSRRFLALTAISGAARNVTVPDRGSRPWGINARGTF